MKILLLGANGQVGFELQRALAPLGDVVAATRGGKLPGNIDCLRVDLGDADSLDRALRAERWSVVVNAAAYTAVDRAEDEPALAQRINGEALAQIGQWAARNVAFVVHYSTDYVFDGQGARPYREEDAPAPLGAYGRSKVAGEVALRESGCDHLILRTAWVYGARGGNFLRTMLRLARERGESSNGGLTVVDDQRGAPTSSRLIGATTAAILKQWRDDDAARRERYNGVCHLAAGGETTWCGFARAIVARAAAAGWIPREVEVMAIRTADFPTRARRPAYSVLDASRLRERFGLTMPEWTKGLDAVIGELAEAAGGK
ncbi:MAG: dTDP-4-dehydrorhamnose reductase [Rudaea sp.]|uniref:dTDP-4-dehydrorhamnose reductase n=1 Tax=Rudaea sp. TaxID=2136325 RepID=UPI0039E626C0